MCPSPGVFEIIPSSSDGTEHCKDTKSTLLMPPNQVCVSKATTSSAWPTRMEVNRDVQIRFKFEKQIQQLKDSRPSATAKKTQNGLHRQLHQVATTVTSTITTKFSDRNTQVIHQKGPWQLQRPRAGPRTPDSRDSRVSSLRALRAAPAVSDRRRKKTSRMTYFVTFG